jgi:hypothetical protein
MIKGFTADWLRDFRKLTFSEVSPALMKLLRANSIAHVIIFSCR